jgi:hypothetical protein
MYRKILTKHNQHYQHYPLQQVNVKLRLNKHNHL